MSVYREIRLGRRSVFDEEQSIIKSHLKLSGVVRREDNALRLRNRIYGQVFDRRWINENLPFSLRDRWEQLKPAIPYVVGLSVIAASMGALALYALDRANEANNQSRIAKNRLEEVNKAKNAEATQRKVAEDRGVKLTEALKQSTIAQQAEATQRKVAEERKTQAETAKKLAQQREAEAKDAQQAEATQRKVAEERKTQAETAKKLAEKRQAEAEEQRNLAQKQEKAANTGKANAEILADTLNAENLLSLRFRN